MDDPADETTRAQDGLETLTELGKQEWERSLREFKQHLRREAARLAKSNGSGEIGDVNVRDARRFLLAGSQQADRDIKGALVHGVISAFGGGIIGHGLTQGPLIAFLMVLGGLIIVAGVIYVDHLRHRPPRN